jgi:hypothetical protein
MGSGQSTKKDLVLLMAYNGIIQTIMFGQGGLQTDDPHTQIPPSNLVRAINCSYEGNKLGKAPGAIRFNSSPLSSGVVGACDWWPTDIAQRLIAVTADGNVWRIVDKYTQSLVLNPTDTSTNTLQVNNAVSLVQCGNETGTNPKKLMIFTGNNVPQLISGDATTRTDIPLPALDWLTNGAGSAPSQNQPTAGILHNNRVWAWGNRNNPHQLYASNPLNHGDFQTLNEATFWPVYPGEHQAILGCYVFKGRLFIGKYPFGIYYLDDSDPSYANWVIRKYTDSWGFASSHAGVEALNDLLIANSYGTITSATAVLNYGGFDMADLLVNTRTANYVRDYMNPLGNLSRQGIYYEKKKQVFFSYRSTASTYNDQLLYIDYSNPQQTPKIAWWNHLQPNCLFLRRDVNYVPRPWYGANDGYLYMMDQKNDDVAGNAYTMDIMTPAIDFVQDQQSVMALPGQLGEINKFFDFLELTIECTGKWNLSCDVFLDGKFSRTIQFTQSKLHGTNEFQLNADRTYDGFPFQIRKKLYGRGKRIAFRFYSSGLDQNITLLRGQVYFRIGSQGEKDAS